MSKHSLKGGPVLRVKAWAALTIAVVVSAEVGIAIAFIARFYGHRY